MVDFSVSGLSSIINQLIPEPHAGLMVGLLFGTKASLSQDFYAALIASGTLHIIALSGMNVSIIMNMIAKSLQWFVGRWWASLLSVMGIIWFVWFVGPSATIVRAAIMGCLSLVAILFGRQYWAIFGWVLAVGIMLVIHISWLFDISFQLSTLATLGIILFGKTNEDRRGILNAIKENLHLTFAAQVFTIPLILFSFHRISLVSPLANLAIGWVISPLTILGWATAVFGWVWLPLGQVIAWIDWVLLEYMIRVIWAVSIVPGASLGW